MNKIAIHYEIEVPLTTEPYVKTVRRYTEQSAFEAYDTARQTRIDTGDAHMVKLFKVTREALYVGVPRVKRVKKATRS